MQPAHEASRPSHARHAPHGAMRLRLVSYNIAHARGWMPHQGFVGSNGIRRNLDRIATVLRELDADLVALQEIDSDSLWNGSFDHVAYLREQTGLGYAAFGASNDFSPVAGRVRLCYGNALLSRHPIALAEAHRFGSRWIGEKGLLYAEVEWHHMLLPVVSLHLHHRSRTQRRNQATQLLALLSRRDAHARLPDGPGHRRRLPALVAGDFNCAAHRRGDATESMLGEGQILHRYQTAPPHTRTYPSLRPTRMLDYWLVPPGWKIRTATAVRTRASDHLPVVVDVDVAD